MDMPMCELLDLIAVEQIKTEGYRYKKPMSQQQELFEILRMR